MSDSFEIDAIADSSVEQYVGAFTTHPVFHAFNSDSSRTRDDMVALSPTAKAKLFKQEGMSIAEIADQLDLPVSTVQADLGIAAVITQTNVATA